MSKRYILAIKTVPSEDFSCLSPEFNVIYLDSIRDDMKSAFYSDILPNVEGILATGPVNAELIAKTFALKVIVVNGAGYNDIDIAAAGALHIPVYNIPDVTARPTAEMTLALMLSASRRVTEMDRKIRTNADYQKFFRLGVNPGYTLQGKTLGIIGMGNIGSQLAGLCRGLNMNVIYYQRHQLPPYQERMARYLPFDTLLAESDVISLHCPVNDETRGMINDKAFRRMKYGAILINTGRGALIDQEAMIRYLQGGKLAAAGLDVYPDEPNIDPRLMKLDNVVLTPHFGTNTVETRAAMAKRMAAIIRTVCNGGSNPAGNLINPEVL